MLIGIDRAKARTFFPNRVVRFFKSKVFFEGSSCMKSSYIVLMESKIGISLCHFHNLLFLTYSNAKLSSIAWQNPLGHWSMVIGHLPKGSRLALAFTK